jgi:uncharacterized protein YacL
MNQTNHEITLSLVALAIVGASIVVVLVFIALWDMRIQVAYWLLGLITLTVLAHIGTHVTGKVNEQHLRRLRFKYQEETPLIQSQGQPKPSTPPIIPGIYDNSYYQPQYQHNDR